MRPASSAFFQPLEGYRHFGSTKSKSPGDTDSQFPRENVNPCGRIYFNIT